MTIDGDNRRRQRKHFGVYTEQGNIPEVVVSMEGTTSNRCKAYQEHGEMCMARENQMLMEKGEPVAHRLTGVSTGR